MLLGDSQYCSHWRFFESRGGNYRHRIRYGESIPLLHPIVCTYQGHDGLVCLTQVTGKVGPLDHGVYGVGYCSATQTAGFVTGGKVNMCETTHTRSKTFLTQEP